jgi:hypothetical protein
MTGYVLKNCIIGTGLGLTVFKTGINGFFGVVVFRGFWTCDCRGEK